MKKTFYLLFCLLFGSCSSQETKINGISFVASPDEINADHIEPITALGANWAAVMPFGFIRNLQTPIITYDVDQQWWGERIKGAERTIELLNQRGIAVMLKPQIWVWRGEFTGNIKMNSEKDWSALEKSYEEFIMTFATLADKVNIPIFCIGTELHTFVQERPGYWKDLIIKIRAVYNGKITYAENWDQFHKVPFAKDLDYIGVDAYFPLSDSKTPSLKELKEAWQPYKKKMKAFGLETDRPILFTEFGYRSVFYTAKAPWNSNRIDGEVDLISQQKALQALYEEFWKETWFAGGFLWKWFHNHGEAGGPQNNRFTVQNKPAEELIHAYYTQD